MQRRAELTRQAVLEGAAASFEKHGYGTANMTTILATAGVSRGAMYFHFSSKEDLAHAVIAAQHELAMAGTRRVLEHTPRAIEAIVLVSKEMARQLVTDPVARGGMRLTLEIGSIHGPIERPYLDWIDTIHELAVRAADDNDLLDGVDPAAFARFVVGAFTGVQTLSEVTNKRTDLYDRLREMWEMLLPGLVPRDLLDQLLRLAAEPPTMWE